MNVYRQGGFDGLFFALGDGWAGVDLDEVIAAAGVIDPKWETEARAFESYTETSPSGLGLRVVLHAAESQGLTYKRGNIEAYDHARFISITGHHLEGTPRTVEPRQTALDNFRRLYLPARVPASNGHTPHAEQRTLLIDDELLIQRAIAAEDGGKFKLLWDGEADYPSPSEARMALLVKLAFWTGKNAEQMDRLFRRSQQMSAKFDSPRGNTTLGWQEIARACEVVSTTYEPQEHDADPGPDPGEDIPSWDDPPGADEPPEPEPEHEAARESTVATFPVQVLPARVARFIRAVADSVPCPVDFVGVPLLAVAGAAIGNSRVLEVHPGWRERACLWALIVGRSGDGKSPALEAVLAPIQARQDSLHRQYRAALAEWHARKDDGGGAGLRPLMEHATITDATLEALANALLSSPRGLLLGLDEATAWVKSFNQYRSGGKGADRPHWLKIWGSQPTTAIRVSREEPVHLPATFVAVTGGLPPDMLTALGDEEGREDGFLARLLFAYPIPLPAAPSGTGIAPAIADDWTTITGALWRLAPLAVGNGQEGVPMLPAVATFTRDGEAAWLAWSQQHADDINRETFPDNLRAAWSKFRSYLPRLALIVHSLRWACGEEVSADAVDGTSVQAAIAFVAYFQGHARRTYAFLHANQPTRDALGCLEWLRRQKKLSVTTRDVERAHLRGISNSTSAEQALKTLERLGYGCCTQKAVRGGRCITFTRTC